MDGFIESKYGRPYRKKKQKTITWAYLCGEKKQGARDTKRSREKIRKEKQGSTYAGKRRRRRAAREAFGSLARNDKEKTTKKGHENENRFRIW